MILINNNKKSVVLLSGGMDSVTCLAISVSQGYQTHALSFRYGQRHSHELKMARKQVSKFNVSQHLVISIDLEKIGGSSLTGWCKVPQTKTSRRIPNSYVPARNTIFLSVGLAWAEVLAADVLFIGANQIDFSGYPDCRRPYLRAFEKMANLATKRGIAGKSIRIEAPLLDMSKAEIIQKGLELGVDFRLTHTCYSPSRDGLACGRCPSCRIRLKGFAKAGVRDPLRYQSKSKHR